MSEQKIENCPFCGGQCRLETEGDIGHYVSCIGTVRGCFYFGPTCGSNAEAIAAHNRVSRTVQKENAKPLREQLKDAGMALPPGYDGSEIFD